MKLQNIPYIAKLTNEEIDLLKRILNEGIKISRTTKLEEFGNTRAYYIASNLVNLTSIKPMVTS